MRVREKIQLNTTFNILFHHFSHSTPNFYYRYTVTVHDKQRATNDKQIPLKMSTTTTTSSLTARISVVAAFGLMVVSNFLSTATKLLNNTDNAQISRENPTYLSPDGATFSIWGLIYLFEAILVVYQAFPSSNAQVLGGSTRQWIVAAFIANAVWLPIFSYHRWFLSFAVIVGYLYSLYKTNLSMKINYGDNTNNVSAAVQTMAMVGISLNMAWVVVATLLNFTIVSRNSGIIITVVQEGVTNTTAGTVTPFTSAVVGGDVDWAILCIVIASLLAMYRAWTYADVPYSFVTAWALGGIYRMQTYASDENFPKYAKSTDLANWAITFSLLVGVGGLVALSKAVYRGCTTESVSGGMVDAGLTRRLSGNNKPETFV